MAISTGNLIVINNNGTVGSISDNGYGNINYTEYDSSNGYVYTLQYNTSTTKVLGVYNGSSWSSTAHVYGYNNYDMFFDQSGNLYIAGTDVNYNPQIYEISTSSLGLINTFNMSILGHFVYNNTTYVIKSDGLYTVNNGVFTKINNASYSNERFGYDGNLYATSGANIMQYNPSSNTWVTVYTASNGISCFSLNIPGNVLYTTNTGVYLTDFSTTVQLSNNGNVIGLYVDKFGNINYIDSYSDIYRYNIIYNFSLNNANNNSFNTVFDAPHEYNAILQRSTDGTNYTDLIPITQSITTDNYYLPGLNYYYRIKYTTFDGNNIYYNYSSTISVSAKSMFSIQNFSSGGLTWSNSSTNRGTGYVTLTWPSVTNATGYKVWIFDGNQYRAFDVGNTTSWDSRSNVNGKIWPTSSTNPTWSSIVNSSNNSISTDVFNHSGGGGDLPDDPNLLYQRTVGTSYDSNHYYTFAISAYNQYGESPLCTPVNITLPNMTDTNAPTISSFTIDDGAAKTGSPQLKLSISATDTGGSGLSKIEISTDNFATIQQTVSASGNSFSTTINNFQVSATPGTINVYVRAWDVAGNVSSIQKAQIALMNDVTPPTAQLKINNGAEFTTNPNVTLYITAYDDWTPIDQLIMRLSNDGKNWTSWMPLALTYNWTLDSSSQGYKSVFLQVQDASANVGTTSAGILYSTDPNVIKGSQIDTTPPTISYLSLAKGATVTSSFTPTITLVASDNVTPQNQLHVYASADGVNWVDLGLLTSNNITLPSGLVTSGFNSIEFKVEDSSYNDAVRTLEFFKL
ncbi:hypothetical protein [Thermoanaerobacterium aotearoense]|nr:hypothetical protein [Thermoanaerobacterium aotearoense]